MFRRIGRHPRRRPGGAHRANGCAVSGRATATAGDAATRGGCSPEAAFLNQYCITCHNQRTKAAGLALDTLDIARVGPGAETWEKVVKKIRTGMMPPSGARRPERAALDRFASELESRLDRAVDANAALADAGAASTESHRVRQRDSRSAGARRQRQHAAAGRWIERGLRQPRRGAGRVTVADSGLRLGGDEDQPPRRRRSHAGAVADDVRAAGRAGAGPPHRRAPARHARRRALSPHVPARCGVRVLAWAGAAAGPASISRSTARRSRWTIRAASA